MSIHGIFKAKIVVFSQFFFVDFEQISISKNVNVKSPFLGQKVETKMLKILRALQTFQ